MMLERPFYQPQRGPPADSPGTLRSAQTLIAESGFQGPGEPGSLLACQQECGFSDSRQISIAPNDDWMSECLERNSPARHRPVPTRSRPGSAPSAFPHATGRRNADQANPTV